jgi:hypothetical protein
MQWSVFTQRLIVAAIPFGLLVGCSIYSDYRTRNSPDPWKEYDEWKAKNVKQ